MTTVGITQGKGYEYFIIPDTNKVRFYLDNGEMVEFNNQISDDMLDELLETYIRMYTK